MAACCSGRAEDELAGAGAFRVYKDAAELRASLDEIGVSRRSKPLAERVRDALRRRLLPQQRHLLGRPAE